MWLESDRARAPANDFPPRWASAWGDDRYGLWAELRIDAHRQRFRWIEPGAFRMHPQQPNENGGLDESSGIRVQLNRGFWFADSRCADDLWTVLTSTPPLRKPEGDEVTHELMETEWHDVLSFFSQLHQRMPDGIIARLPSEAEWEYATLAGRDADRAPMETKADAGPPMRNAWGIRLDDLTVWEMCRPYPPEHPSSTEPGVAAIADMPRPALRYGAARYPDTGMKMSIRVNLMMGALHGPRGFRLVIDAFEPSSPNHPQKTY